MLSAVLGILSAIFIMLSAIFGILSAIIPILSAIGILERVASFAFVAAASTLTLHCRAEKRRYAFAQKTSRWLKQFIGRPRKAFSRNLNQPLVLLPEP